MKKPNGRACAIIKAISCDVSETFLRFSVEHYSIFLCAFSVALGVSVVNVAEEILTTESLRSTESHRDSEIRALPALVQLENGKSCARWNCEAFQPESCYEALAIEKSCGKIPRSQSP